EFLAVALAIEPFAIRADRAHALPRVEQEFDRRGVDELVDAREIDGLAQMLDVGRLEQNLHRPAERLRPLGNHAPDRRRGVGLTLRVELRAMKNPGSGSNWAG